MTKGEKPLVFALVAVSCIAGIGIGVILPIKPAAVTEQPQAEPMKFECLNIQSQDVEMDASPVIVQPTKTGPTVTRENVGSASILRIN